MPKEGLGLKSQPERQDQGGSSDDEMIFTGEDGKSFAIEDFATPEEAVIVADGAEKGSGGGAGANGTAATAEGDLSGAGAGGGASAGNLDKSAGKSKDLTAVRDDYEAASAWASGMTPEEVDLENEEALAVTVKESLNDASQDPGSQSSGGGGAAGGGTGKAKVGDPSKRSASSGLRKRGKGKRPASRGSEKRDGTVKKQKRNENSDFWRAAKRAMRENSNYLDIGKPGDGNANAREQRLNNRKKDAYSDDEQMQEVLAASRAQHEKEERLRKKAATKITPKKGSSSKDKERDDASGVVVVPTKNYGAFFHNATKGARDKRVSQGLGSVSATVAEGPAVHRRGSRDPSNDAGSAASGGRDNRKKGKAEIKNREKLVKKAQARPISFFHGTVGSREKLRQKELDRQRELDRKSKMGKKKSSAESEGVGSAASTTAGGSLDSLGLGDLLDVGVSLLDSLGGGFDAPADGAAAANSASISGGAVADAHDNVAPDPFNSTSATDMDFLSQIPWDPSLGSFSELDPAVAGVDNGTSSMAAGASAPVGAIDSTYDGAAAANSASISGGAVADAHANVAQGSFNSTSATGGDNEVVTPNHEELLSMINAAKKLLDDNGSLNLGLGVADGSGVSPVEANSASIGGGAVVDALANVAQGQSPVEDGSPEPDPSPSNGSVKKDGKSKGPEERL